MKIDPQSRTAANLQAAFTGESMAMAKYLLFARKARRAGYEEIAERLEEAANNEKEHAGLWLNELARIGTPEQNLEDAIAGETLESASLYPEFAAAAEAEGYKDLAWMFQRVAAIEQRHGQMFRELLEKLNSGDFRRRVAGRIVCRACGHIPGVDESKSICSVCGAELPHA